jgi:TrmH family RNA methyltransferase
MKNMGLDRLVLIEPRVFPSPVAVERASGADDVLNKAKVCASLEEGVADCQWLFATSARSRSFPWPQLTPFDAAQKILELTANGQSVGVLFGCEQAGLSNAQLQQCDFHIAIPSNPEYSSLNLGCAVQIICYEIYQAFLKSAEKQAPVTAFGSKANHDEIAGLLDHFERTAVEIGFLDPAHPKKLLPRLKRLFAKAQLEKEEVNLLRGFLKLVRK